MFSQTTTSWSKCWTLHHCGHTLTYFTSSCIALPGLGYHPFTAWQHDPAADPFMWLRESLPQSTPGTQIFLYGYDAKPHDGGEPTSAEGIALSLISGLRGIGRSSLSAKPVVFLAHSLGGSVLKQCPINLANAGQSEMFMLRTVKACIFMAVPNCLPGPIQLNSMVHDKRFTGLLKELQAAKNVGYLSSMSGMLGGIAQANGIRLCSGYETVEASTTGLEVLLSLSTTVTDFATGEVC